MEIKYIHNGYIGNDMRILVMDGTIHVGQMIGIYRGGNTVTIYPNKRFNGAWKYDAVMRKQNIPIEKIIRG